MHPGSYTTGSEAEGLRLIADRACAALLAQRRARRTMILLEHTAGQGTNLGHRFEHLARILELLGGSPRVGVCLDTCHLLDGRLRHLLRRRISGDVPAVRSDRRPRPHQGLPPERLEEALRQPRRSARAHRQGMPRARAVPAAGERRAVRGSADAARDAETRNAGEPAQRRRRSVGRAQPAHAPSADATGSATQMVKRWIGGGRLALTVLAAMPRAGGGMGLRGAQIHHDAGHPAAAAADPSLLRQVPDHASSSTRSILICGGPPAGKSSRRATSSTWTPTVRIRSPNCRAIYEEAIKRYGAEFVVKNGDAAVAGRRDLRKAGRAFRQKAPYSRDNIKFFSSVLAHYVSDAHVPFHAALNYDGQLTGQWGIHSRFETELFERYQSKLTVVPPRRRAGRQRARTDFRYPDREFRARAAAPRRRQGGGRRARNLRRRVLHGVLCEGGAGAREEAVGLDQRRGVPDHRRMDRGGASCPRWSTASARPGRSGGTVSGTELAQMSPAAIWRREDMHALDNRRPVVDSVAAWFHDARGGRVGPYPARHRSRRHCLPAVERTPGLIADRVHRVHLPGPASRTLRNGRWPRIPDARLFRFPLTPWTSTLCRSATATSSIAKCLTSPWRRQPISAGGLHRAPETAFLDLLAEAERERRQGPAEREPEGWMGRAKARSMRWVAESIAEQRLLWHLRRQASACLYYPDDIEEAPAVTALRQQLRRDFEKHRFWLCIDSAGFVLSGCCSWCPAPTSSPTTSPSAWSDTTSRCAARARGWTGSPGRRKKSVPLAELRRVINFDGAGRERRVTDVATALHLEHFAKFFERVAVARSAC